MIDPIIYEYLKSNKRLTIPELGTLVRRGPEGELVLVTLLRKDDGILAGLLRTKTGTLEERSFPLTFTSPEYLEAIGFPYIIAF